eukprot:5615005-Pleurochrysis_carterae.AAC.1
MAVSRGRFWRPTLRQPLTASQRSDGLETNKRKIKCTEQRAMRSRKRLKCAPRGLNACQGWSIRSASQAELLF